MDFVHILNDVDILLDLNGDQLRKIADISEIKTFHSSEIIFKENTTSNELYIIMQGMVEILIDPSILGTAGSEATGLKTIATLRSGESFGEVALVDQGLRSASAMCVQDETKLLVVPQKEFNELCRSDFEMGFVVMRNIAGDLSFKLRQTDIGLREQIVWGKT
ncbi:MAG: cyclic nucleotide-binding domain-containing protein [Chloroflexota bacterium]